MSSQSEGDSVHTKERLLSVALELLEEGGAKALTIRNIAKHAGIAISVVHHHYINKEGLLDACKADFYRRLGEVGGTLALETAGKSNAELVEHAVRRLFAFARTNIPMLRLLSGDVLSRGQLIDGFASYEKRPLAAAVFSALGPKFGLSEQILRSRVQALSLLVTRFAVSTDKELVALFGGDPQAALGAAEEELVAMAKLLLLAKYEDQ